MSEARIWFHAGIPGDVVNRDVPTLAEPWIARQKLTTSATAVASQASPPGATLAVVIVTVATKYRVIPPGGSGEADADDMPLFPTKPDWPAPNVIHCPPGAVISLIEG